MKLKAPLPCEWTEWTPPPAKSPGEKFRRLYTHQFTSGTPVPFKPQHNFGTDEPSQALRGTPKAGGSLDGIKNQASMRGAQALFGVDLAGHFQRRWRY